MLALSLAGGCVIPVHQGNTQSAQPAQGTDDGPADPDAEPALEGNAAPSTGAGFDARGARHDGHDGPGGFDATGHAEGASTGDD